MNKKKLLALLVSSAFLFAACGDDESPLSPKNTEKEISSSSEDDDCDSDECEEKSSSSKKEENKTSSSSQSEDKKSSDSKDNKSSSSTTNNDAKSSSSVADKPASSSSVAASSSSVEVPAGARTAKLEDLEKNLLLDDVLGDSIYLSTGSKKGVFALRIPDQMWAVTYSDFANGVIDFSDAGMAAVSNEKVDKVKQAIDKGLKISFIVDDGKVKYAVNDSKTYREATKASVTLPAGALSDASKLVNKVYSCTDGDTTKVFNFFDGTYILEKKLSNKVVDWFAGNYDVQRGTLLMLPQFFVGKVYSLYNFTVGSADNKISGNNGVSMSCTVEAKTVKTVDKTQLVGEWQAYENGVSWELSVTANGEYKFLAYEGTKNVEHKKGVWSIYGDNLLMRNTGCLNTSTCSTLFRGTIEEQTANGFKFKHDDTDTPHIPFEWSVAQVE